jgi:hypothetical protein
MSGSPLAVLGTPGVGCFGHCADSVATVASAVTNATDKAALCMRSSVVESESGPPAASLLRSYGAQGRRTLRLFFRLKGERIMLDIRRAPRQGAVDQERS